MNIRPEEEKDYPSVWEVNQRAFDNRESEPRLVERLRRLPQAISLVAEVDGCVVGHILFSPMHIQAGDREVPAIALGPLAVLPEYQGQGIGIELSRAGIEACREAGHGVILVLGHPTYYPRFGFAPAHTLGIDNPYNAGEAYMALELIPGYLAGIQGLAVYPPAWQGM